ncbi:MAG: glycosyltransferase [Candidatus Omnitrophica bacterium]|nr:glycosyltransferase [Candidatus Omnitrophota bacterium]
MMNPLEEYQPLVHHSIEDYREFIGEEKVREIKRIASTVEGKSWSNVNSTLIGGGVAEMLTSVIPLARSLGVDAHWYVIRGNQQFFQVTKKFHNMLQGIDMPVTLEEIFGAYLNTIDDNAQNTFIASDLVVVHDPQPAALVMKGVIFGNILWRCHIDTSSPSPVVWKFLLPYINQCAGAIFTMPQFVGKGTQVPIYQIMPCIDPRAPKNQLYERDQALNILSDLFQTYNVDPERPILTAISRYDIHKNQKTIIKAFHRLKKEKNYKRSPYLIFLGNTASDDPEGEAMLAELKAFAGDDPDILFWVNVENNDEVVGALMHIAQAFIHVSTKEGFGLVVSEALWQGTPVIGSTVGGICKQVVDGQTGYLVDPLDDTTIAAKMAYLLDYPDEAESLGKQGREHVRANFLLPELVRRYLILLRFYSGQSQQLPEFRLDDLIAYKEILRYIHPHHPILPRKLQF